MKPFSLQGEPGGLIYHAKRGHKKSARVLARGIAELLREDEPLPEAAKQYLIEALQMIADGESGNTAFNTAGRKGIREPKYLTLMTVAVQFMQNALESGEAKSHLEASLLAEELIDLKLDADSIRKAHRKKYPAA